MATDFSYLFALCIPASFIVLAAVLGGKLDSLKPKRGAITAIVFVPAILAMAIPVIWLMLGPGSSPVLGIGDFGFSARVDALSAVLAVLVSFLGAVVLSFSAQYLDGDPRHARFMALLCLTLAAVTLLVVAGNLYQLLAGWISMSLALHGLLVFRAERPAAVLAARKKFLLARVSDGALLLAALLLITQFGTADLSALTAAIRELVPGSMPTGVAGAAGLIALAAVLKTAQFPTHGWLVEVMETPTPVSALLHAGVVNAGGFLLLRFADLMLGVPTVMLAIAALGAITAIVGSAIMLTRTDQKGSLAYSTVAQMGFMIFQCGLGAFSAAAVHLVGHSLYKAYAFLSSGGAVGGVATHAPPRLTTQSNTARFFRVAVIVGAVAVYGALGVALQGIWPLQPVVFALGMVFVLGAATFAAAGVGAGDWSSLLAARVVSSLLLLSLAYFGLQYAASRLLADVLPSSPAPGIAALLLLLAVAAVFIGFALLQIVAAPGLADRTAALRVHLANGLYINLITNRMLGAYRQNMSTPSAKETL